MSLSLQALGGEETDVLLVTLESWENSSGRSTVWIGRSEESAADGRWETNVRP